MAQITQNYFQQQTTKYIHAKAYYYQGEAERLQEAKSVMGGVKKQENYH